MEVLAGRIIIVRPTINLHAHFQSNIGTEKRLQTSPSSYNEIALRYLVLGAQTFSLTLWRVYWYFVLLEPKPCLLPIAVHIDSSILLTTILMREVAQPCEPVVNSDPGALINFFPQWGRCLAP